MSPEKEYFAAEGGKIFFLHNPKPNLT